MLIDHIFFSILMFRTESLSYIFTLVFVFRVKSLLCYSFLIRTLNLLNLLNFVNVKDGYLILVYLHNKVHSHMNEFWVAYIVQ